MPLLETKGAGSAQGFGLSLGGEEAVYVEDVFSTYLYTGTGASLPIVNGIDLDAEGGLVWTKSRSDSSFHKWYDSARGISFAIESNTTDANQTEVTGITSFNSNGYTYGTDGNTNSSGTNYVSWTFRKQPKFFDVVTYTGTGTDPLTLNHNLQSVPGVIIIKCTSATSNWRVHSAAVNASLVLNLTNAGFSPDGLIKNLTSTTFQVNNSADVNSSGATYVAYLFAHDAGGFGESGTDNVISCGTFTGNTTVTLGFEPQWIMLKSTNATGNWDMHDVMRGWPVSGDAARLRANLSDAESQTAQIFPNATGFSTSIGPDTFIYIAIRRGPMKVPTSGAEVYTPIARTGTNTNATISGVGFSPDLVLGMTRSSSNQNGFVDRLRGINPTAFLQSTTTASETSLTTANNLGVTSLTMDGVTLDGDQTYGYINFSTRSYSTHFFKRAPGFFDEVCYTGTGSARTVAHNLAAVPELMIVKRRNDIGNWIVYHAILGNTFYQNLNYDFATSGPSSEVWSSTTPSSSSFSVANFNFTNASGSTFVAYLFATLAGVSKVGSYTGTGTTQVINCGFTAGARFVLIKRTDSTGNWLVADSARGIVAGNDPLLYLNSTATEITTLDWIDADSSGFIVNQEATANANVNAASYIYFAVA